MVIIKLVFVSMLQDGNSWVIHLLGEISLALEISLNPKMIISYMTTMLLTVTAMEQTWLSVVPF